MVGPTGPWMSGADGFALTGSVTGRPDHSSILGVVKTADQTMSAGVNFTAFKLGQNENEDWDFYAINGDFTHGVLNFGKNAVSVGYYGTHMILELTLTDENGQVWDSGPTSTVDSSTTGFNIGGNLSGGSLGGQPILQAGISASFGDSFTSPSVSTDTSVVHPANQGPVIRWDVRLPGVGYVSPAVPANPEGPSSAGYEWYYGAIWALPSGNPFALTVAPTVSWEFDYTRGITNDTKTWAPGPTTYTFQPSPAPTLAAT